MSTADYAEDKLLGPIGMRDSELTTDAAGNTRLFMGLRSSCEDMARFGHLFLERGRWDDTQVVPEAWVEEATGGPSQDLNQAYGYLWWLNQRGTVLSPLGATTGDQGVAAPRPSSSRAPPRTCTSPWAWAARSSPSTPRPRPWW